MGNDPPEAHANTYRNFINGATPNPVMPNPDDIDKRFADGANRILENAVELIRVLIGAHQSAAAIVVQDDWTSIRKFFSLSSKYAAWAEYRTPATGYGTHGWLLRQTHSVRFSQQEFEAHPDWKNFGNESATHPPMRGWLAAPILDKVDPNLVWGLLQASDKYEGEFSEQDEANLVAFAQLVSEALGALWAVRNFEKSKDGGTP